MACACRRLLHFYVRLYASVADMSPAQCLKARTLLNWTPADLARAAGVSVITVRNFEAGKVGERAPRTDPDEARAGRGGNPVRGR